MNEPEKEFFDELMEQVSLIEKSRVEGCVRSGSGGDCLHYFGLPGQSIPGDIDEEPSQAAHVHGKPHGWCWSCWKSHRIDKLEGEVYALEAWQNVAESNIEITAYLRERFPNWPGNFEGYTPTFHVRKVVEYFDTRYECESEKVLEYLKERFLGWKEFDKVPRSSLVTYVRKAVEYLDNQIGRSANRIKTEAIINKVVSKVQKERVSLALEKLSGDLNYDNVAAVKEILKGLL